MPDTQESLYNIPGRLARNVFGYELDSDKERQEDQRQVALLERLAKQYPTGADRTKLDPRLAADIGSYERGELGDIQSPYHYRGWWTPGAPLYDVVQNFASVPQMAVAGSQRLANWVDPEATPYPKAKQQFDSALNSFTGYGAEAMGLVPKGTPTMADVAEEARAMRGNRPEGYWPGAWNDAVSGYASQRGGELQLSAADSLEAAGVPRTPALIAGTAMDSVLDPWNGLGGAVKAARAGKRALGSLVGEFGLGQAMVAPSYGGPVLAGLLPAPQPAEYRTRPGDYTRGY
jgi:hypothetical protein